MSRKGLRRPPRRPVVRDGDLPNSSSNNYNQFNKPVLRRPVESSNYTSYEFATKLAGMDMRQSVGRTGISWGNLMAESLFVALKNEWTNRTTFTTHGEARQAIVYYIEGFYNRQRLHSGLGYKAPLEVHNEFLNGQLAP